MLVFFDASSLRRIPLSRGVLFIASLLVFLTACTEPTGSSSESPTIRNQVVALEQGYAEFRAAQISNVHYELSVDVSSGTEVFSGTNRIRFKLASGNVSPLTIDFDEGTVSEVLVNGKSSGWTYDKWFISIDPEGLVTGENEVVVEYQRPYSTTGNGLHRYQDPETGNTYIYTNFEPYSANKLFPHFDQPNLKARYLLDVRAPKSWHIVSATRESSIEVQGNARHWSFPESALISSYIFPLHGGPFHVWEDLAGNIPLRLFARQELAEYVKPEEWFTYTKQSFTFFNEYFESPYPFVKYDQLIVPDFNFGAMENLAAVTFNESFVKRGEKLEADKIRLANVIAHEMAHMWFGNLVTMDWWNGLWLNESFATYMANLALVRASDFDGVWDIFYSRTKQWAYHTDQQVTTHSIELEVPTTSDAFTNFDGITYGKGASVLKQLPYYLGEETFRRGVVNYIHKFSYKNTALEDFLGELQKAAGKNLDQWKVDWLDKPGLNSIEAAFTCNDGNLASLALLQTAPDDYPTLRGQRVQIGLFSVGDTGVSMLKLIPVTYQGEKTVVDLDETVACPNLVYPNYEDWAYVKVLLDPVSKKTLAQSLPAFENASLRMMLWESSWDAVQDVKISLLDHLAFVVKHLGTEPDKNIVARVTSSLVWTDNYLAVFELQGLDFAAERASIESVLLVSLQKAAPGSDIQKKYFDSMVSVAHTAEGLAFLRHLVDDKIKVEGLVLDQDRRWNIIRQLNRELFSGYQVLTEKEHLADKSDRGQLMYAASQAVRPGLENKKRWLAKVIDQRETTKLALIREVSKHLFPASQAGVHAQLAADIYGAIPSLKGTTDESYDDIFGRYLLPVLCGSVSAEQLSKHMSAMASVSPIMHKKARIAEFENRRCLNMAGLLR